MIWIARWDGKANTSTSYIRNDGWRPGGRVKQYQGGHNETWGGVTINIDRNFLDVGKGSWAPPETPLQRHHGSLPPLHDASRPAPPTPTGQGTAVPAQGAGRRTAAGSTAPTRRLRTACRTLAGRPTASPVRDTLDPGRTGCRCWPPAQGKVLKFGSGGPAGTPPAARAQRGLARRARRDRGVQRAPPTPRCAPTSGGWASKSNGIAGPSTLARPADRQALTVVRHETHHLADQGRRVS